MVKLNRIYTRTGDAGTTGLVDGSRVAKDAAVVQAMGDVDEANSALGLAIVALGDDPAMATLLTIQNDLFDVGADLATPAGIDGALRIVPGQVTAVEAAIDRVNADLTPLTSFILPGGTGAAAALHLARAIVRRAERSAVAADHIARLNPDLLAYLNRLSDFLFVLARKLNKNGTSDVLWVPGGERPRP
ncbi:cob(I)yrinic acid a c-diamide adenosyltransferase [Sphingomonas sp. Leaf407]|uniref:cob(I)yrinic acid a,c-diamide adenosyltransferase n=1 Tax=unclassified Sphingomonas TaxID=196159 RepID=UPI0006FE410B|nr:MULTISPECIES: cob(I)yrinic acid a,c-diamide adenosyltransferase [unclassified Sphingomonas]KQN37324.1 cob(I)yrinic acid a c-diamide adenosyltransferase [Sphingomonas sp. Leaf42]KQT27693.1 cob(I)yrinic acid a c-diamide adenosyltransferase [Sphingomonas sp. Leaf407]